MSEQTKPDQPLTAKEFYDNFEFITEGDIVISEDWLFRLMNGYADQRCVVKQSRQALTAQQLAEKRYNDPHNEYTTALQMGFVEGYRAAQSELDAVRKERDKLKGVIQSALNIKDLWLQPANMMSSQEHQNEAKALNSMFNSFTEAL